MLTNYANARQLIMTGMREKAHTLMIIVMEKHASAVVNLKKRSFFG